MVSFECVKKDGRKIERWSGSVSTIVKYSSHYEIRIESRSGIMVLFGKTTRGGFACMPDFGVGCHIIDLKNIFWNTEKLSEVLGKVDGITVAEALYALSDSIEMQI